MVKQHEESYKPRDISIIEAINGIKQADKRQLIEMKTIQSLTLWKAKFSERELQKMQQYGERYILYRVY
ncbi:MAG: protein NO VEIN domain-containing protein, partial [Burkholderiales bacterium]